jgi:hypothetical protein
MTQTEANASPKDAALRLALEALENLGNHDHVCPQWPTYAEPENYPKCNCGYDQAITAIKAALEAKDEPVVWNEGVSAMLPKQKEGETFIVSYEPKLETKDEPVSTGDTLFRQFMSEAGKVGVTHLTPPQRKPLTDEELLRLLSKIDECAVRLPRGLREFARAIEVAHGIKGEA